MLGGYHSGGSYFWLDGTPVSDGYQNWFCYWGGCSPGNQKDPHIEMRSGDYQWIDNDDADTYARHVCAIGTVTTGGD